MADYPPGRDVAATNSREPSAVPDSPSLELGAPSLELGAPSPLLGHPRTELGVPAYLLDVPSPGLGAPSFLLGRPSSELDAPNTAACREPGVRAIHEPYSPELHAVEAVCRVPFAVGRQEPVVRCQLAACAAS